MAKGKRCAGAKQSMDSVAPAKKKKSPKAVVVGAEPKKKDKTQSWKGRDMSAQVERYKKRKLSHIANSRLDTIRNAAGQSIDDYVAHEMKVKKIKQGRLASEFTTRLWASFKLSDGIFDSMSDPEGGDTDEELEECLNIAHDDNPAERKLGPLKNFISRCSPLDQKIFYGLCQGSLEGPKMTGDKASELQVSLLWYISRTGAHTMYPRYWESIHRQLDLALDKDFTSSAENGVSMQTWMKSKRKLLYLYADAATVDSLIVAEGNYQSVPKAIQSMMDLGYATPRNLFGDAWMACAKDIYFADIQQKLKDLEHNDFDPEEIEAYNVMMEQQARQVKLLGKGKIEVANAMFGDLQYDIEAD